MENNNPPIDLSAKRRARLDRLRKKTDKGEKLTTAEALEIATASQQLAEAISSDMSVLNMVIQALREDNARLTANMVVMFKLLEGKGLITEEDFNSAWKEHVTKPLQEAKDKAEKEIIDTLPPEELLEQSSSDEETHNDIKE